MRRIFLVGFALLFCFSGNASAQPLRAITQDGKTVILNPDRTWKYADEAAETQNMPIELRGKTRVELPRGNYVMWIDENKWQLDKKQREGDRQTFSHVKGDGYAMAITERVPVPIATLKKLAMSNAREFAPDARVTFEEMRRVNGLDVLCLRIAASHQGIQFTYYGYYHSNSRGNIQVVTYTADNLFGEFQRDFTDFLNGLAMK